MKTTLLKYIDEVKHDERRFKLTDVLGAQTWGQLR